MEKKGSSRRRPKRRLRIIKALVAEGRYDYSAKIQGFIEDGDFDLEDLERCILSAREIQKVEVDELDASVDGCKYTVIGIDKHGVSFYTCGKIIRMPDDERLYFFITAHEQQEEI
jgi:hypothetical protein